MIRLIAIMASSTLAVIEALQHPALALLVWLMTALVVITARVVIANRYNG